MTWARRVVLSPAPCAPALSPAPFREIRHSRERISYSDRTHREHPRPIRLLEEISKGDGADPALEPLYEEAVRDTIEQFEATGSPVITDGEQRKYHNFWTYSVHGLPNTSPDGFRIPFAAGHTRRMLQLTGGPFRYRMYADRFLDVALRYAHVPVKQAVISASALSLMYPADPIQGIRARSSSTIYCSSTRPKSAGAWQKAPTRFKSTSRKDGWRSSSTRRASCSRASST